MRRDDDKGIKRLLKWIPACAGMTVTLDDSLRSPFGPPLRAFNAQALLSGMRRDDDKGIKRLLKWTPGMRRDDGDSG